MGPQREEDGRTDRQTAARGGGREEGGGARSALARLGARAE